MNSKKPKKNLFNAPASQYFLAARKVDAKAPSFNKIVAKKIVVYLLIFLGALLACSGLWVMSTWSTLDLTELVYHLRTPLTGSSSMVANYMLLALLPAIITSVLFIIFLHYFNNWNKRDARRAFLGFVFATIVISLAVVGRWVGVTEYIVLSNSESRLIDDNYVDPEKANLLFPSELDSGKKDRNVIILFLESTEITFALKDNGGAFELKNKTTDEVEDILPNLTKMAQATFPGENILNGEDFGGQDGLLNGATQVPGTGWTAGSLFAQTSGLPLNVPVFTGENSVGEDGSFFPEANTLTDVLASHGYKQAFMCGSDVAFGGRKTYFLNHGLNENDLLDYKFYEGNHYYEDDNGDPIVPEGYFDNVNKWWGFEDFKLFNFAKSYLTKTASTGIPFNFMMLTVDTHFANGYKDEINEGVYEDIYESQYANVYRANDKQVYSFVNWFFNSGDIAEDVTNNTSFILVGDHETMDSHFCVDLDPQYRRRTYCSYLNSAVARDMSPREGILRWHERIEKSNSSSSVSLTETGSEDQSDKTIIFDPSEERTFTAMDTFPTALASMGVKQRKSDGTIGEIGRLGIGTNLFSGKQTLAEEYGEDGISYISHEFMKKSELLRNLFYGKTADGSIPPRSSSKKHDSLLSSSEE